MVLRQILLRVTTAPLRPICVLGQPVQHNEGSRTEDISHMNPQIDNNKLTVKKEMLQEWTSGKSLITTQIDRKPNLALNNDVLFLVTVIRLTFQLRHSLQLFLPPFSKPLFDFFPIKHMNCAFWIIFFDAHIAWNVVRGLEQLRVR